MCGRLACCLCKDDLIKGCSYLKSNKDVTASVAPNFIDNFKYKYTPSYNICPSKAVPVMIHKHHPFLEESDNSFDLVITPMRWGIVTTWSDDLSMHNARIENAMNSKIYARNIISGQRCVVLCNGYYEWQNVKGVKQPYYIYQEGEESHQSVGDGKSWVGNSIMKLAAIFNLQNEEDVPSLSCSIITKEADEKMSSLHHRMPIALTEFEDVNKWINNEQFNHEESWEFLTNYNSENQEGNNKYVLKYYPVNKQYINSSSHDSDKCIERVNIKRQSTLDSFFNKQGPAAKR